MSLSEEDARQYIALLLTEISDHAHCNCETCEGGADPVCCADCFPLNDDARVARRAALDYGEVQVSPATLDELAERVSGGRFTTMSGVLDFARAVGALPSPPPPKSEGGWETT